MVIIDAAIALPAVGHVGPIKSRVGHRGRPRVTTVTSSPRGLLLPRSNEEEDATCKSREANHTNHNTSRDGSGIVTALGLGVDTNIG